MKARCIKCGTELRVKKVEFILNNELCYEANICEHCIRFMENAFKESLNHIANEAGINTNFKINHS